VSILQQSQLNNFQRWPILETCSSMRNKLVLRAALCSLVAVIVWAFAKAFIHGGLSTIAQSSSLLIPILGPFVDRNGWDKRSQIYASAIGLLVTVILVLSAEAFAFGDSF
jgi:hypothetical protein